MTFRHAKGRAAPDSIFYKWKGQWDPLIHLDSMFNPTARMVFTSPVLRRFMNQVGISLIWAFFSLRSVRAFNVDLGLRTGFALIFEPAERQIPGRPARRSSRPRSLKVCHEGSRMFLSRAPHPSMEESPSTSPECWLHEEVHSLTAPVWGYPTVPWNKACARWLVTFCFCPTSRVQKTSRS